MRLRQNRQRTGGFSLIELLVALTISALLIVGAVNMYSQSRGTYRASEEVARLQETARYAMSFIESDLRMANFWGLNSRPDYIDTAGLTINACSTGWATDVNRPLQGFNGNKGLACIADDDFLGGDVFVIRRAANERETGALTENAVYVQTSRIQGTLFIAPASCSATDQSCLPSGYLPPQSETHRLLVHGYYVSPDSTGRIGTPSLRRVRLIAGGSAPAAQAEEIIPGIEDMQVEFGVDTDFNATAEYYVSPNLVPATARVVSARVWLRVRSDQPDFTFEDGRTYQYAGETYTPGVTGDANRYRRLLVSKTIQLRNTRYEE